MELLIITQNRISLSLQSGRILQCDLFGLSTDRELGWLKKWIQVRSWRVKLEGVWQIHSLCWQAFFLFLLTPFPCLPLLHVPLGYEVREHGKKEETPPRPPPPLAVFFFLPAFLCAALHCPNIRPSIYVLLSEWNTRTRNYRGMCLKSSSKFE